MRIAMACACCCASSSTDRLSEWPTSRIRAAPAMTRATVRTAAADSADATRTPVRARSHRGASAMRDRVTTLHCDGAVIGEYAALMATSTAQPGTGRRAQILAVAAQLFAKHGFHGVTIADLGAAVGVSGPALYRHFPSKEALLAEMLVGISEHLLAGGQQRAASGG